MRLRRRLGLLLFIAVALAAAGWLGRDLPRQLVAQSLARQLEATVTLTELRIVDRRTFDLVGLVVERPADWPQVVRVSIDRLRAVGRPAAIVRGDVEFLRLLGAEVVLQPAPFVDREPGNLRVGEVLLEPARVLVQGRSGADAGSADEDAELRAEGRLLDFGGHPHGELHLHGDRAHLAPWIALALPDGVAWPVGGDASSATVAIRLDGDRLRLDATAARLRLAHANGEVALDEPTVTGTWRPSEAPRFELELAATGGRAHFGGAEIGLPELAADATVAWTTSDGDGETTLHVEPRLVWLESGSVEATWGDGLKRLDVAVLGLRLAPLLPLLPMPAGAVVDDPIVDASLSGPPEALTYTVDAKVARLALAAPALAAHDVRADLEGDADLADLGTTVLAGEITTAAVETGDPALSLAEAGVISKVRVRPSGIELRDLRATGTLVTAAAEPLPLRLSARLVALAGRENGRVEELEVGIVGAPEAGRLHVAGDFGRTEGTFQLRLAEADLAGLAKWVAPLDAVTEGDLGTWLEPPPGYAASGTIGADVELRLEPHAPWTTSGTVHLAGAGFSSADGARVVEGLAADFDLEARRHQPGEGASSAVEITVDGEAGNFLALWNTYFADFSTTRAALRGRALIDRAGWRLRASGSLPDGPRVSGELSGAEGEPLRWRAEGVDDDLSSTVERYFRSILGDGIGLAGRVEAKLAGEGSAKWGGEIRGLGIDLRSGGGELAAESLSFLLPVDLRRAESGAWRGSPGQGELSWERLYFRDLSLPPLVTELRAVGDTITLLDPVELPVFAGLARLERLRGQRLLSSDRSLEAALRLDGLRLEEVSEKLGLPPLEGAVDGYLPRIRLDRDRLVAEGGGQAEVLGGSVDVRDISARNLFTRFPELTFSADIEDIDLGQLTRRIDFGEMQGVLRGSIVDCNLFAGIPTRFAASFETVDRPGVPRKISVKAVQNLSLLGTGEALEVLNKGLRGLFDEYTYARLALEVELAGDRLRIRGLERRGDRELFLRGRLPFPIDIVNARPGHAVSFRAMRARLQALGTEGLRIGDD